MTQTLEKPLKVRWVSEPDMEHRNVESYSQQDLIYLLKNSPTMPRIAKVQFKILEKGIATEGSRARINIKENSPYIENIEFDKGVSLVPILKGFKIGRYVFEIPDHRVVVESKFEDMVEISKFAPFLENIVPTMINEGNYIIDSLELHYDLIRTSGDHAMTSGTGGGIQLRTRRNEGMDFLTLSIEKDSSNKSEARLLNSLLDVIEARRK